MSRLHFATPVALALVLTALFASVQTAHAVPLIATYGGPAGFGTNVLPGNDDGSSAPIDLTPAFPGGLRFFGGPYMQTWVNNNGNITFSGPVFNFTPTPFPVAARPMIAPYWADVDTRGGGAPARNGVYWHLEPGRMVVTWHNVGYFAIHDDRQMDFQMIVTNALDCRSGDFDVEFRYNTCGWTTGDASGGSGGFGGTPGQAGFDAGNGVDFVEIPGSRTMAIIDLCTTSNVGEPGIWRFTVRGGAVSCPGTGVACPIPGGVGACSAGVTQCMGREVICSPIGTATPERCDNVDNDCNGMIDDGMGLCSGFLVCVGGSCVPPCFEGGCATDYTCCDGTTCQPAGACVETSCLTVTCADSERCEGGVCIGACSGITCPHGQQCIAGRCANLCDILTCASDEVCFEGACVPRCPCRPCLSTEICGSDGSCTPIGCDITICDPGFYCDSGACLDACDGAVCPPGQVCEVGECVEMPLPDAGIPDAPDAGPPIMVDAGVAPSFDGGFTSADGGRVPPPRPDDGGCGCTVPTERPTTGWLFAIGAVAVLAWRLRRKR